VYEPFVFCFSDQLGLLRSFFNFLGSRPNQTLPRALTEAQVKKLIRAASHPRDRALIELHYATGCRIGDRCPFFRVCQGFRK
jgi:site-specific recombinase XerD